VNQSLATSDRLAYIDGNGKAILKVDNSTNVPFNEKRNTVGLTSALNQETAQPKFFPPQVRITTQDSFPVGSVFLLDALHVPYGCSVWPGTGNAWPSLFFRLLINIALVSFLDNGYSE
jgi:hypothetical protein